MTAYATTTDLTSRAPEKLLANVPLHEQEAALEDASREADSYLCARYTVPLVTWTSDFTSKICDLAIWRLASKKQAAATNNPVLRINRDDAISWLRAVSKGTASIGGTNTDPSPSPAPRVTTGESRGW